MIRAPRYTEFRFLPEAALATPDQLILQTLYIYSLQDRHFPLRLHTLKVYKICSIRERLIVSIK